MNTQTPTSGNLVTDSSLKLVARGLVLGALVSTSVAAAVSSAGVAAAACTPGPGINAGAQCAADETSFSVQLDGKSSVSAQGRLGGFALDVGHALFALDLGAQVVLLADQLFPLDVFVGGEAALFGFGGVKDLTGVMDEFAALFAQGFQFLRHKILL